MAQEEDRSEGNSGSGDEQTVTSLQMLLDRIDSTTEEEHRVSLGEVVDAVGRRSFVPLLLLPGLVMLAPVIGDIPGVPVLMGLLVILVATQLLLRRQQVWLPDWLRNRKISSSKISTTISWLRRPARWMDRWSKPRYSIFVNHASVFVIAATCIAIAAATPVMEVVPMSANLAGAAITAFGLALLAHDGLIAILAVAFSAATMGLLVYQFL